MARKKSTRRTLCFKRSQAGRPQQTGFYLAGSMALLPHVVLFQLRRTDGLWLASVPFTSGAGSADMTGMASGWQPRLPPPTRASLPVVVVVMAGGPRAWRHQPTRQKLSLDPDSVGPGLPSQLPRGRTGTHSPAPARPLSLHVSASVSRMTSASPITPLAPSSLDTSVMYSCATASLLPRRPQPPGTSRHVWAWRRDETAGRSKNTGQEQAL